MFFSSLHILSLSSLSPVNVFDSFSLVVFTSPLLASSCSFLVLLVSHPYKQLQHLNEANLLENLRCRYTQAFSSSFHQQQDKEGKTSLSSPNEENLEDLQRRIYVRVFFSSHESIPASDKTPSSLHLLSRKSIFSLSLSFHTPRLMGLRSYAEEEKRRESSLEK